MNSRRELRENMTFPGHSGWIFIVEIGTPLSRSNLDHQAPEVVVLKQLSLLGSDQRAARHLLQRSLFVGPPCSAKRALICGKSRCNSKNHEQGELTHHQQLQTRFGNRGLGSSDVPTPADPLPSSARKGRDPAGYLWAGRPSDSACAVMTTTTRGILSSGAADRLPRGERATATPHTNRTSKTPTAPRTARAVMGYASTLISAETLRQAR